MDGMWNDMARERFNEILQKEGYSHEECDAIWNTRPPGVELTEEKVRRTIKVIEKAVLKKMKEAPDADQGSTRSWTNMVSPAT